MNRTLQSLRHPALLMAAMMSCGSLMWSACSPKAAPTGPMTWHGQVKDRRFSNAPSIELTGSPGALAGSVFLIGGEGMDPFDAKLKLPTTVVSQTDKEIQLHVTYKTGEQADTIVEFAQPLSDASSPAKVHEANQPPYQEFIFKPVR